ncbi:MAG TPA: protease inhibitor I42 family protein [Capillimicrobium sp.]|jgi:predicted secreted protein
MHGRRLIATLAATALAAGAAAAPAAAKTVRVTEADSGEVVRLEAGDKVQVVLDANPSTGYRWKITAQPNPQVARILSSRYVASPVEPGVVGSGGQQITVLKAKRFGRTRLGMEYVPPGRRSGGSDFELLIRVKVES